MAELPDGTRLRKTFCRRTKTLAKAAYENWMQHKTKQIAKRKTVAVWGEECLEIKRDSVSYCAYQNYELHWHLHIKPTLGKKLLDQVKPVRHRDRAHAVCRSALGGGYGTALGRHQPKGTGHHRASSCHTRSQGRINARRTHEERQGAVMVMNSPPTSSRYKRRVSMSFRPYAVDT